MGPYVRSFERHRSRYYDLLFSTSAAGAPAPRARLLPRRVTEQSRDAEERAVRLVDPQRDLREVLRARANVSVSASRVAGRFAGRIRVADDFDAPWPPEVPLGLEDET